MTEVTTGTRSVAAWDVSRPLSFAAVAALALVLAPALGHAAEPPCQSVATSAAATLAGKSEARLTLERMAQAAGVAPVPLDVSAAPASIRDQGFGDFRIGDTAIRYDALPGEARGDQVGGSVYFGRPALTRAEAMKDLTIFFQFGRSSRGAAHRDLRAHVRSTRGEPSGFLQTSKSYDIARGFAAKASTRGRPTHGIVLIIDPRRAQLLDVSAVAKGLLDTPQLYGYASAGPPGVLKTMTTEGEVLFSGAMPPTRIAGAVLLEIDHAQARARVLEVFENPNYTPELYD
jgi:hypothetical protein